MEQGHSLKVVAFGATLLLAMALGLALWLSGRRGRRSAGMIATHLLLGIAALEQVAMLLGGTADWAAPFPRLGGLFVVLALVTGVVMGIWHRSGPAARNAALLAHAGMAAAAAGVFATWAAAL